MQTAEILETLAGGGALPPAAAQAAFDRLMSGEMSAAQAGSFLMGLRSHGETPELVASAVRAALSHARLVEGLDFDRIDIVGTGGDGKNSFNCSTATALTLAGMGYKVIKHGNRAVSSTSGSADVVEGLGLPLETAPEDVPAMLAARNFVFLFAPFYHPAFKHVMPVRRELGIRTLFNVLGPLLNPARPTRMLLGVARPELLRTMAGALQLTGVARAAVVHGAGGYDELTTMGPAGVVLLENGKLRETSIDPAEFGFATCAPQQLEVHDKSEALTIMRQLLNGQGPAPMLDMIAFNTGLAVYLMENAMPLADAMEKARAAVEAGTGGKVLNA
ncbi:anthranilate phosphoribosyltransferase [Oleidesulfovibrio sp.]|uniref:anthranilate phosphoribosyltransferase n=1 Tax=Oleidesulfovibrio sp. TaxID=2909707 RepID=UPI003A88DFD0